MSKLSVIIITNNEEDKIESCLKSVSWADEIIIVDNYSQDRTADIAKKFTKNIYERMFDDYSSQKNFALEKVSNPWVFWIDADEMVTSELKQSMQEEIRHGRFSGYMVHRRNFLFGRELRFGGQRNDWHLRMFKKAGSCFSGLVHEKVNVGGTICKLKGDLIHKSSSNLGEYFDRLERYTNLEAISMKELKRHPSLITSWIKPLARFVYVYFIRLGFLDGWAGLKFHTLSSYNMFLSYRKCRQLTI